MPYILVALLFLGGCAVPLDRVEELGAAALTQKEEASALVVKGCKRYLCKTGRIGPVQDEFATPEEKEAWEAICKTEAKTSTLLE